jgi:hypothetical protein
MLAFGVENFSGAGASPARLDVRTYSDTLRGPDSSVGT